MKRVVIAINTSWNIYHFRAPLIRAFQDAGYEVISIAPHDQFTPRLKQLVNAHYGIPMQNAGTSVWHDSRLLQRYRKLLKKIRPDILLCYTIKPNIYATLAAASLGIPVINNVSGLGTAFIRQSWLTWLVKHLYRHAFRYSSHVYFQNTEDKTLFEQNRLVKPEKTSLLPGSGINLERYHPEGNAASNDADKLQFLLIARMLWDKGVGEFVDAARLVKAQYPLCRFRLLGPTDVINKTAIDLFTIQGWVEEGMVDYLGEQDDVREAIAVHDCIVLPSYREGMSRVLLEAAAMGKPLIASDVPGCREAIEPGINGLLCQVRDAQDLADNMLRFIRLDALARQEMGTQSRKLAESRFDERIVIRHYLDEVLRLIGP